MKLLTTEWSESRITETRTAFPDVEIVRGTDPAAIAREIADAEIVFGHVSREAFLAAKQLRWIQYSGAGVEKLLQTEELVASDVIV